MTTIVIPCFNQARFIDEALRTALAQPECDVIVVDDGSTDGCGEIAARHSRVLVVRQPRGGVGAARNRGLRDAGGEFVLFLDADDRLTSGAVDKLRAALTSQPEAAFAYGRYRLIDQHGAMLAGTDPPRAPGEPFHALLRSNFISAPGAVLFRRRVLVESDGFASGIDEAADYELYLRLTQRHPIVSIPDVVLEYRRHTASMSADPRSMLDATLQAHRRHGHRATGQAALAYRAGRRFWKEFYGDQLMDRARLAWRRRDLLSTCAILFSVTRLAPEVVVQHVARALRLRVTRPAPRGVKPAK
jgi:glycosyltransferase involved in cell wall biosynthesis